MPLGLGEPAPDPVELLGLEREVPARVQHRTGRADRLGLGFLRPPDALQFFLEVVEELLVADAGG